MARLALIKQSLTPRERPFLRMIKRSIANYAHKYGINSATLYKVDLIVEVHGGTKSTRWARDDGVSRRTKVSQRTSTGNVNFAQLRTINHVFVYVVCCDHHAA